MHPLTKIKQGITHLFYPSLCEGCNKPLIAGEQVLCIGCLQQLPETNYHLIPDNEAALRLAGRIPFIHAAAYAHFTDDGLLQHLLHELKYRRKQEIGTFLGRRWAQQLLQTDWISDIDLIIPVPLHPKKEAFRGFNQSQIIAEGMAKVLSIPIGNDVLIRIRETESQVRKTRTERISNMEGAFQLNPNYPLKHKHILLCDDVLTTGATLEACSLALLYEETIKISVVTIGIATS